MKHCPSLAYALTYTNFDDTDYWVPLSTQTTYPGFMEFYKVYKRNNVGILAKDDSLLLDQVFVPTFQGTMRLTALTLMAPGRAHHVPQRHSLATELVLQLHKGSWCWIQENYQEAGEEEALSPSFWLCSKAWSRSPELFHIQPSFFHGIFDMMRGKNCAVL